jgi:UDP-GlcNAc:undecaprenyl-phosphate GlcNAc-1-phosphate transferase
MVIFDYLLVFFIAFAVTFLITPSVRAVALRFSALDARDDRKIHTKVITRFGGLAIYAGFICAMICSFFPATGLHFMDIAPLVKVIAAATLILMLGVYDDVRGANARTKFFIQILAAFFLVNSGITIQKIGIPFVGVLELGAWNVPVTILWLVGITNAINLIDGLDGLAGGIIFISSLGMFASFLVTGIPPIAVF